MNSHSDTTHPEASHDWLTHLKACIDHAAHLLPAQGPITVFIHHNTLHAFEYLTFDEAVQKGAEIFGCEPYLSEERYHSELRKGRIRDVDLEDILETELGDKASELLLNHTSRLDLRLLMLERPIWQAKPSEMEYYLAEAGARRRFRDDVPSQIRQRLIAETRRWVMRDLRAQPVSSTGWAHDLLNRFGTDRIENWPEATWEEVTLEAQWQVCFQGTAYSAPSVQKIKTSRRPRELLLQATSTDLDLVVNDFVTRFAASFLDQGLSTWALPDQKEGFFRSFLKLYSTPFGPLDSWLKSLPGEAKRLLSSNITPLESIRDSLEVFGIPASEWEHFIGDTFLALRGWAGMVREVELRGDRVAQPIPAGSLHGFVAIRLLLDRLAAEHFAKQLGLVLPLTQLRSQLEARGLISAQEVVISREQRCFTIFQLAQLLGWSPAELAEQSPEKWTKLIQEIEGFNDLERRRIFHHAYERRFRVQTLDAIALHRPFEFPVGTRPRFQVVSCLDEREESFRRHIEEVAHDSETFGVAGFFNVVMYYKGAADAHFVPLCPIVLTPNRWVSEQVQEEHTAEDERRKKARQALGAAAYRLNWWSRSFALGAVLSAGFGAIATFPLVARILFPRLAGRIGRKISGITQTPTATNLKLKRICEVASQEDAGLGFTIPEMAQLAERFLRDIGLLKNFAPLAFMIGHGSESLNNPHKSAYDCGACGGSPGGPNGRAIAEILNNPEVRQLIAANGILIPEDTHFVGGLHNTCDDSVSLFDTQLVPTALRAEYEKSVHDLAIACDRNAHERSRRFMSARLDQTFDDARRHVENRSEDLAQVRPELGHATNAICVVGRRSRTRGLYLDRRAFLASYDPTQDDAEGSTLGRLLGAAVPVCGGINLEYYFSHVDSKGYGCGTKLPHNVTSLLGVMDGASSDLRTGLPWQMVEIHEPIRLLFVVETKPEVLEKVMNRIPIVGNMIRKAWVQMALLDPESNRILIYRDGTFIPSSPIATQLPTATSSADWYRGWREHLEFAEIRQGASS